RFAQCGRIGLLRATGQQSFEARLITNRYALVVEQREMNLIRSCIGFCINWRAGTLDAQGEKRFAVLLNGLEFAAATFGGFADFLGIYVYALQQQHAAATRK